MKNPVTFTEAELLTDCVCGKSLEDHNADLHCPIPYEPGSPYAFGDKQYNPVCASLGFYMKLSLYHSMQAEYYRSLQPA